MRASRASSAVLALVLVALVGCSGQEPAPVPDTAAVRFAAYDFSENQILVALYAEAARRAGLRVAVESGVATR